jgi:hypothetical protein
MNCRSFLTCFRLEFDSTDQPVNLPQNGFSAIGAAFDMVARTALLSLARRAPCPFSGADALMNSHCQKPRGCKLPNFLATLVMSGAVGAAYFNCDPMIAGSEPSRRLAHLDLKPSLALPQLPQALVPAPAEPSASNSASSTSAAAPALTYDDTVLRGKWALQYQVALLEKGLKAFDDVASYQFIMTRQERINGDLLAPQVMDVKLRHAPFSLYMKWLEGEGTGVKGRQLIYVDGQYDNKLMIQPGGLPGRLTGTLGFTLDDPMVTAEARHPATECGLKHLANKILTFNYKDLAAGCQGYQCELHDNQMVGDRPCYLFIANYDSPERSPTYRKVAIFLDKQLSLPIAIRNYTWADNVAPEELDEVTLIESYAYSEIVVDQQQLALGEEDWSTSNSKYKMKVRTK